MKDFIQEVKDYYPTYLLAHQHPANKLLHFVGNLFLVASTIGIGYWCFTGLPFTGALFVLGCILPAHLTCTIYLFAWPAHLLIEKNKPATWTVSRWITKACDWVMMYHLVTRKLKLDTRQPMFHPKLVELATSDSQVVKGIEHKTMKYGKFE